MHWKMTASGLELISEINSPLNSIQLIHRPLDKYVPIIYYWITDIHVWDVMHLVMTEQPHYRSYISSHFDLSSLISMARMQSAPRKDSKSFCVPTRNWTRDLSLVALKCFRLKCFILYFSVFNLQYCYNLLSPFW